MENPCKLEFISALILAADATGKVIRQLARIAYAVFGEPPWQDDLALPRLHFGLGVDLMRPGAKAFSAHDKATGEAVGYIFVYEACKRASLPNTLTLRGLSIRRRRKGFLLRHFMRRSASSQRAVAESLSECLNDSLRSEREFTYRLDRTQISAEAHRGLYRKLGFPELPVRDIRFPDRSYGLLRNES